MGEVEGEVVLLGQRKLALTLFIISCTSADPNIFLGYRNSSLASFLIDTVNSLDEVHRWHRLNNGSDQLKVKGTFTARVKGRWSSASQL